MAFDMNAFNIVNVILSVINILSHGLGITLLGNVYDHSAQQLMIIHLSVAELITSILRLAIIAVNMSMPPFVPPKPPSGNVSAGPPKAPGPMLPQTELQFASHYLQVVVMTGMFFIIFLIMMAITLDRLLTVLLKSNYTKVFSRINVKLLLAFIWIVGIAMLIAFPLSYHINDYYHRYDFEYEIYLVTDIVFMVFAIFTFIVVLAKYKGYEEHMEGEDASTKTSKSGMRQWSFVRTMSNSQFYIPFLIMITYFIFIVLPHWIYLGHLNVVPPNRDPWAAMIVMLLLGYWSDAIVYVFLQKPVREVLWGWLCCMNAGGANNNVNNTVEFSATTGVTGV